MFPCSQPVGDVDGVYRKCLSNLQSESGLLSGQGLSDWKVPCCVVLGSRAGLAASPAVCHAGGLERPGWGARPAEKVVQCFFRYWHRKARTACGQCDPVRKAWLRSCHLTGGCHF